MIIFDSCCSCSALSRRVEEIELKYHEMSCPPPRRVTALDFVRGGDATAMEGAPERREGAEENAAAVGVRGGVSRAQPRGGASGAISRRTGAPLKNPSIAGRSAVECIRLDVAC